MTGDAATGAGRAGIVRPAGITRPEAIGPNLAATPDAAQTDTGPKLSCSGVPTPADAGITQVPVSGRTVVGLSGGVDSAVAAGLLKREGHAVVGVFMKNWEDDDGEHCPAREDFLAALAAADALGIELEAVNFAAEYRERVFGYFLREYAAGRTPNPDVLCNAEIKFAAFLEHARTLGGMQLATGHYARVRRDADGRSTLLKGLDPAKDQSYFLCRLSQAQLADALFPLGGLPKTEVRALARAWDLPNAARKDSTGICFIGERPFREFLSRYLKGTPGEIRTPEGRRLGEHAGLMFHTIGQRQGLGIGGPGEPWYVAGKDVASNTLIVVQGRDHPLMYRHEVVAADCSWVAGQAPDPARPYGAKLRYRQADAACRLVRAEGDTLSLAFDAPQWAVTPGQVAVLYDGDVCLGGGVIQ